MQSLWGCTLLVRCAFMIVANMTFADHDNLDTQGLLKPENIINQQVWLPVIPWDCGGANGLPKVVLNSYGCCSWSPIFSKRHYSPARSSCSYAWRLLKGFEQAGHAAGCNHAADCGLQGFRL